MFGFEFKGFSEEQKGYISLALGIILLLHTLNIFRDWFNSILIIAALFLIAYGIAKTHIVQRIIALIQKEANESKHSK